LATTLTPATLPAGQVSYQLLTPDKGPPTPGPTDPNGPAS
jgi:hypothetical protein